MLLLLPQLENYIHSESFYRGSYSITAAPYLKQGQKVGFWQEETDGCYQNTNYHGMRGVIELVMADDKQGDPADKCPAYA